MSDAVEKHGFLRVTASSIETKIGDVESNANVILDVIQRNPTSDVLLFSELSLTGYSIQRLGFQEVLLNECETQLLRIADTVKDQLVVVGLPIRHDNGLYNVAAVVHNGHVKLLQPKQNPCTYNEFYEGRYFRPARGSESEQFHFFMRPGVTCPFGFRNLVRFKGVLIGLAICEDDFMFASHGDIATAMGAVLNLNLSSSPEQVSKHEYRINHIVLGRSALRISAQVYASSGATDSTADVVFGGHCAIAENGVLLKESRRIGDGEEPERGTYSITADVDVQKLMSERRVMGTFGDHSTRIRDEQERLGYKWNTIGCYVLPQHTAGSKHWRKFAQEKSEERTLIRKVDGRPFVPKDEAKLAEVCNEIFGIQVCGLAKRIERIPSAVINLGVSGGLDSTLAALVGVKTLDTLGLPRTTLKGITMPGFGTSDKTYNNSWELMKLMEIDASEAVGAYKVPMIKKKSLETYKELAHLDGYRVFGVIDPRGMNVEQFDEALSVLEDEEIAKGDLTFENVQARSRTDLLMNRGFVLGTGDLSELALGWCTYNADHMSMYNVNCGVPKTLVAWLVRHVAMTKFKGDLRDVLIDITETAISPELLPHRNGEIGQSTEATIGSYTLHDFFLYNFVRGMHSPSKILFLAQNADFGDEEFDQQTIEKTLETFLWRFFMQQYKRECVPNGPKVGTVSLSPRGDWRMPPDAEPFLWLKDRGVEI